VNVRERVVVALAERHPDDAAHVLEQSPSGEVAVVLDGLEPELAARLLSRMDAHAAAAAIDELDAGDAAEIVAALAPAEATALLRRVERETQVAVLAVCPPGVAAAVRTSLAHGAGTAGAVMDPHAPSMPRDLTCADALTVIRERPHRYRHYVYVVERGGALLGALRPLDLIGAAPEARLDEIMRTPVVRVRATDPEASVVAHPGWASFSSLPVVDGDERLVGVIRDDDVRALAARTRAGAGSSPASLAMSIAELLWLGLVGMTEGLAAVVGREARDAREAREAREAPERTP